VSLSLLLLVVAIVLFLIAALLAFRVIASGTSVVGLVAAGLAAAAASRLPL
jgi:hypothetical protein